MATQLLFVLLAATIPSLTDTQSASSTTVGTTVAIPFDWTTGIKIRESVSSPTVFYSDLLYPYGSLVDEVTPKQDDGGSPMIPVYTSLPLFGRNVTSLYVSNNGLLSFFTPYSAYTPQKLPQVSGFPFFAVFWGDINNVQAGDIYYRQSFDTDLLQQVSSDIRTYFSYENFSAQWAFVATWHRVAYLSSSSNKVNTFQAVVCTDGSNSFLLYNYADIQWPSLREDGSVEGPLALAGINSGYDIGYYTIPESMSPAIMNISSRSNVDVKGRWVFKVDKLYPEDRNGILVSRTTGELTTPPEQSSTSTPTTTAVSGNLTTTAELSTTGVASEATTTTKVNPTMSITGTIVESVSRATGKLTTPPEQSSTSTPTTTAVSGNLTTNAGQSTTGVASGTTSTTKVNPTMSITGKTADSVPGMALRLVGSESPCAGRVEILYHGQWGRVCDDYWDLPDAQVVCRQLGCGNAVSPNKGADFGPGHGLIILNGVQCIGDEEFLWNCLHRQYNVPSYGRHKDASVTCSGSIKPTAKPVSTACRIFPICKSRQPCDNNQDGGCQEKKNPCDSNQDGGCQQKKQPCDANQDGGCQEKKKPNKNYNFLFFK